MNLKNNRLNLPSYIALSRTIPFEILREHKLFCLLIYIALRVKRSNNFDANYNIHNLKVGEFITGRIQASKDLNISESEFRTRIVQLENLHVIKVVKATKKFTIYQWLPNRLIDINLDTSQPTDHQQNNPSFTTNNKVITNNSSVYSNSTFNPNKVITLKDEVYRVLDSNRVQYGKVVYDQNDLAKIDDYVEIMSKYMQVKGISLQGKELLGELNAIKDMFDANRSTEDVVKFLDWINSIQNLEEYEHDLWLTHWNLSTVKNKLPEFVAGKLKHRRLGDDLEYIQIPAAYRKGGE